MSTALWVLLGILIWAVLVTLVIAFFVGAFPHRDSWEDGWTTDDEELRETYVTNYKRRLPRPEPEE